MSFLKSAGMVAAKCLGIWQMVSPLVVRAIPGAGVIEPFVNILVTVEQIFVSAYGPDAKKGSDKLKAATPLVAQLIQASAMFQGKAIKDEKLAEEGFTDITGGFAKVLNAYGE